MERSRITCNKPFRSLVIAGIAFTASASIAGIADARTSNSRAPALIISHEPLPQDLQNIIYTKPQRTPAIQPADIMGRHYYQNHTDTVVGRRIDGVQRDLFELQSGIARLAENLASLEGSGQQQAANYYASIATINTQLQAGTTPGNPRLIQRLGVARSNLEQLAGNVSALNDLAIDIASNASAAAYMQETVRAMYSLSGAIEEDHVRLAKMEDAINNTVVVLDRMLNNVNDDITRTSTYLHTERENLRTLSLAISSGEYFGRSLSSRPFSSARLASFTPDQPAAAYAAPQQQAGIPGGPRPLVKIRFDRQNVNYEQPVYMAVNEALNRYPDARFELVAVHPNVGNQAEIAIESTRARRNAERVLRSLTQMGLNMDRIDLSYTPSDQATTNEVHLYIR